MKVRSQAAFRVSMEEGKLREGGCCEKTKKIVLRQMVTLFLQVEFREAAAITYVHIEMPFVEYDAVFSTYS